MEKLTRALLSALLLTATAAFGGEGIAFVSNLKGEVAIDGNPRPALLTELSRGQKIFVGKESQASVMYIASGKEYVLKGAGEYLVKDTEIAGSSGIPPTTRETAWRTNNKVLVQVAQTSAASVRMRSFAPAREDKQPKLLYPTYGTVATLQPTFRWRAPDPMAHGEFVLFVAGQEKPVHLGKTTGNTYRVPAKLRPDTAYSWTVTVAGSELGTGRFRTLSADAMKEVEKRKPSDKGEFSDRLLYTLMLHEMGAAQDARESWERLSQERADLPELAAFAK